MEQNCKLINIHIHMQSTLFNEEKIFSANVARTTGNPYAKERKWTLTIYKNKVKMDQDLKRYD